VCVPRSARQVADILGVLLAGAAFLPLDPDYPTARLRLMVSDARVETVVAAPATRTAFDDLDVTVLTTGGRPDRETPPGSVDTYVAVAPAGLAYVIYTSGSTGRPKGVELTHEGLSNVMDRSRDAFGLTAGTRVLQFASPSFDVAVWELFMALTTGGTLCLTPADPRTAPRPLADLIDATGAAVMFLTPAVLALIDPAEVPCVRLVLTGGDRVGADLIHRWRATARFFAVYGPTEGTIVQTWGEYRTDRGGQTPIGYPIGGVRLYVLDADLEPVPYGAVGEVYVGGVAVGRGYRLRPALTADRFLPDPYASAAGARMYRTGDLVRRHPDGELTFVGRVDSQVKVRGFRVELGEVQAGLGRLPAVAEAVALVQAARPGGPPRLVAYVVLAALTTEQRVREALRTQLPGHLIPDLVHFVDAIPRTANGKVAYAELRPREEPPAADLRGLLDRLAEMTDEDAARLLSDLDRRREGNST
jgi:amino acid adenylation domain-containing protein